MFVAIACIIFNLRLSKENGAESNKGELEQREYLNYVKGSALLLIKVT